MAQFKYTAQTKEGKKISGKMTVADEAELQQRLHQEDAYLLTYKEVERNRRQKPLKTVVLADFCRQLSTLTESGVTLVRSLSIISQGEAVKPKHRAIYEDLLKQVRQGIAMSDAMEAQNGAFPPLLVYMFRSAESSGNLDKVCMQMAEHYEKSHRLSAKLSSSMTYPKILGAMIVLVVIIITKLVLPQFADMLGEMDEIPTPTRILMGISSLMENYWLVVLIVVLGVMVGFRWALTIDGFRIQWHKLQIKIPVFGPLNKTVCTARFARSLSSLYTAGIPIVPALQISRKTIGNDYIDSQFDQVVSYVRAGNDLSDGLDMVDGFVRKLTDSIRVGEETGSLDNMLVSTADSMEYDSDMAITKMVSFIEPIMLLIMGAIVAFVLLSVFSALYGSYDSVAGMA